MQGPGGTQDSGGMKRQAGQHRISSHARCWGQRDTGQPAAVEQTGSEIPSGAGSFAAAGEVWTSEREQEGEMPRKLLLRCVPGGTGSGYGQPKLPSTCQLPERQAGAPWWKPGVPGNLLGTFASLTAPGIILLQRSHDICGRPCPAHSSFLLGQDREECLPCL